MNTNLPAAFVARMQEQLGSEFDSFMAALQTEAPVSVRKNQQKELEGDFEGTTAIPWCETGVYLEERPVFTLDPAFHAGAYYVQEASSMLLEQAFKTVVKDDYPVRVLDLCAAPGGKSTLLASLLPEGSILVSNETVKSRIPILKENINKWGHVNTWVTGYDPSVFAKMEGFFDVVVVDAPCSGEGLFRKDQAAAAHWSEENVLHCADRQKRILAAAEKLVAPGGSLIYSTCTYNYSENEGNAEWLESALQLQSLSMHTPADWGVVNTGLGYQCYPHKVKGEGFYISVFRKTKGQTADTRLKRKTKQFQPLLKRQQIEVSRWLTDADSFELLTQKDGTVIAVPKVNQEEFQMLTNGLPAGVWSFEIGELKGDVFLPSHALALSNIVSDAITKVSLSKEESLHFLKKEAIDLTAYPKGWVLVQYNGLGLGWVKNLGNRVNNYLPKEWRIRMEIE